MSAERRIINPWTWQDEMGFVQANEIGGVDRFFEAYDALAARLAEAGCWPASTLLGVTRLAFPELLVEIEATAVA